MSNRHGSRPSRSGGRAAAPSRLSSQSQCLCLNKQDADRLGALADDLGGKRAVIARGLCLISLALALGDLGQRTALAFRIAASDPTPEGLRDSLDALVDLLPPEALGDPRAKPPHRRTRSRRQDRRRLEQQGLRLTERGDEDLLALTAKLCAEGFDLCPAHVIRGLFLLALDIATGGLGSELAAIFCRTAAASSSEGTRDAVQALRALVQREPSTRPAPPPEESTASSRRDSAPPPTLPARRA
jgi:hypothetical protein